VDRVPLRKLIGKGAVIDVKRKSATDRDYQVRVENYLSWEEKHGDQPVRVAKGAQAAFFGPHPKAVGWLAGLCKVKAVDLDTPSIDYSQSTLFESHVPLLEKNTPVFENYANLGELPERGFTVIALLIKIKGESGKPLRIVAILL
jgi:kynurenine formamidase